MPTDPKTPGPNATTGIRVASSRIPSTATATARKRDSTIAELDASTSTLKKPFPFPTPRSGLGPSASMSSIPSMTTPRPSSSLGLSSLTTPKPNQTPSARLSSTLSVSSLQRQLLLLQTTKTELESKLRERDGKIERLERDRRSFVDREKELTEEWEKERTELETEKKDLNRTLSTLRTQFSTLQEDHTDLESSFSQLKSSQSSSSSQHRTLIDSLNSRISLLEREKLEAENLASQREHQVQELTAQLDQAAGSLSSSQRIKKSEDEDSTILTAELSRLTAHLRTLETTNSKLSSEVSMLRDRHASIEVLREENRGLKAKLEKLEEWRERVVALEAELEDARSSVASAASSGSAAASAELSSQLSNLRLTHAQLSESHGSTVALLKQREVELRTMEEREIELRMRADELEGEKEGLDAKVKRGEKEVEALERELKFLGDMVAKLTSEREQTPAPNSEEASVPSNIVSAQADRIRHLESLVEETKRANEELRDEVEALGGNVGSLGRGKSRETLAGEWEEMKHKVEELEKELAASTSAIQTHLDKIEDLEQQLFELGGEIAGGRHVPPGTRILSLADNPAERWFEGRREVLERMKGENEGLMRRVGELEERLARAGGENAMEVDGGSVNANGMVPRESWELVCKEKEELEEEVKAKEKRLRRLKEIFNSKGAEFRDAIASILGVKLAFFPNGDVRVTSVYDLTTSFVFQAQKKGRTQESSSSTSQIMQLVAQGEGGPANLPETMRYWIEEEQCIPGFMASVTLECYDGWKTQGRGQGQDEMIE